MNKILTISRQYSSGGREIGQKLAEIWGIPFYDIELITRAAQESGYAVEAFQSAESRATSSLLYSIARGMVTSGSIHSTFNNLTLDDRLYMAQADIIRKILLIRKKNMMLLFAGVIRYGTLCVMTIQFGFYTLQRDGKGKESFRMLPVLLTQFRCSVLNI